MNTRQVRSQLNDLKLHLGNIEEWVRQANDMIYQIEEMTFDYEDGAVGAAPDWNEIMSGYDRDLAKRYKDFRLTLQA